MRGGFWLPVILPPSHRANARWLPWYVAPRRWEAALEGGEVPDEAARTAGGRGAAAEAMRRRRPVVLRGAAAALVPTVVEEVGSMKRLT